MSEIILELKNANIYQGNSLILQHVNISVSTGEFIYLVGKTGTGKSSLLKTLYGELPLKEGQGKVVGFDLTKLTWKTVPFLRRNIGIVFQDFQLLTDRNVHDNLEFVLKATGWQDKKLMEDLIIRNFLKSPQIIIPSVSDMNSNKESFIKNTYKKFLNREPNEMELWQFEKTLDEDPSITPEMVYYSFLTSNEYRHY